MSDESSLANMLVSFESVFFESAIIDNMCAFLVFGICDARCSFDIRNSYLHWTYGYVTHVVWRNELALIFGDLVGAEGLKLVTLNSLRGNVFPTPGVENTQYS